MSEMGQERAFGAVNPIIIKTRKYFSSIIIYSLTAIGRVI